MFELPYCPEILKEDFSECQKRRAEECTEIIELKDRHLRNNFP